VLQCPAGADCDKIVTAVKQTSTGCLDAL